MNNDKLGPPETEIRADMWGEMTLPQLHRQRDHVVERLSKLQSMMSFGSAPPTVTSLYMALQMALKDLTGLIDNRATRTHTPKKGM